MTAVDNNSQRKLKFKITSKGIRGIQGDSGDNTCGKILIVKNGQMNQVPGAGMELPKEKSCSKPSVLVSTRKRSPDSSLVSPKGKLRKMDRIVKVQCGKILKELINQDNFQIFREPVDPEKLCIPDYFLIISKPMDLGTIKKKLDGNVYSTIDEFAADVKLTFANALLYNAPGHQVHTVATTLNNTFNRKWKLLEAKLKSQNTGCATDEDRGWLHSTEKNCPDEKRVGVSRAPVCTDLDSSKRIPLERRQNAPMSSAEKLNLRSDVLEALNGKMTEKLRLVFQKFGLTGLKAEKVQSYVDSTDDLVLRRLRKELGIVFGPRAAKVNSVKFVKTGSKCSGINVQKAKCSLCGSLMCHCREKNATDQAFPSDLSLGKSSDHENSSDAKLDNVAKYRTTCETIQSCSDSDGPGVVVNGSPCLSIPSATAASGEGWTTFDIPLSPKKALRAAMLKSRFASTIYKATHQGEKSDPLTMQQEKEKLEREQLEEKARIEREIKEAEAAMRKKAQEELKMKRDKEREAARIALQKMERTVEIYESHEILRELEALCYSPVGVKNPLEQLGLHMKDDDCMEEEDDCLDGEEGEIVS